MKLINSDKLRNDVLKWMPPDPCGQEYLEAPFESGQEYLEAPFETDICVSMIQTIDEQEPVEAIPCDYIQELIQDPNNAGNKRYVLSWLLERWKNESERNN